MPGAMRAHERQNRARHVRQSEHIGLEQSPDVGVVALFDRREVAVPRIVDENVDASKMPVSGLGRRFVLLRFRHVQPERQSGVRIVLDEILNPGRVARRTATR